MAGGQGIKATLRLPDDNIVIQAGANAVVNAPGFSGTSLPVTEPVTEPVKYRLKVRVLDVGGTIGGGGGGAGVDCSLAKVWESDDIPMTPKTMQTIPHGIADLDVETTIPQLYIVCRTAALGIEVGETLTQITTASDDDTPLAPIPKVDATNVYVTGGTAYAMRSNGKAIYPYAPNFVYKVKLVYFEKVTGGGGSGGDAHTLNGKTAQEIVNQSFDNSKTYTDERVSNVEATYIELDGRVTALEGIEHNFIPLDQKAAANGVATLDADTKVPIEQLPLEALDNVPVGTIVMSLGNNVWEGWLNIAGDLVSRATYPQLWEYAQANGNLITEEGWQALAATQGSVGQFSTGDGSTTFRLPNIAHYPRGQGDSSLAVGRYLGDAIRNITGHVGYIAASQDNLAQPTGTSLYWNNDGNASRPVYDTAKTASYNINFNASRTVPTAEENRPKTIIFKFLIKAYGAIVNTGGIDIGELANTVNTNTTQISNIDQRVTTIEEGGTGGDFTGPVSTPQINFTTSPTNEKVYINGRDGDMYLASDTGWFNFYNGGTGERLVHISGPDPVNAEISIGDLPIRATLNKKYHQNTDVSTHTSVLAWANSTSIGGSVFAVVNSSLITASDAPTTNECFYFMLNGVGGRKTVICYEYGGSGRTFKRNIYNNAWNTSVWIQEGFDAAGNLVFPNGWKMAIE